MKPKIQQILIEYDADDKISNIEFVIDDEVFTLDDFGKDMQMQNHLQNIVNVLKSW